MHLRWAVLTLAVLAVQAGPVEAARRSHLTAAADASSESPVPPSGTVTFDRPCAKGERLTIIAVGDLLFHKQLEQQALTPTGTYRDFWQPLADVLAKADLTYANFEGAAADGVSSNLSIVKDPGRNWNNSVYSAPVLTLSYNYHPSVIDDLLASGFDVVSTANNHALDRGSVGVDRTVFNMQKRGMAFSGTRDRSALDQPFSVVTRVKGLNVAWLACTFSTNGFADVKGQVLNCFSERDQVLAEIGRLAASPEIDAVILTPHWGVEGSVTPEKRQRTLAQAAIEAGATAVVGTHPHVVGPWEKVTTPDGREGLVVYSTGNFISNQRKPEQRIGELALLELTKEPGAAKMRVTAAGYITTFVDITSVHRVEEATPKQSSRVLPAGNRVFVAGLPNLPRSCGTGEVAAASWNNSAKVIVAKLPMPDPSMIDLAARIGEFREPRGLPSLPSAKLVDFVAPTAPPVAVVLPKDLNQEPLPVAKKRTRAKSPQISVN